MKTITLSLIRIYQKVSPAYHMLIKSLFGLQAACRFTPTCSVYTYQAVQKYGTLHGLFLGIKRFIRCNPFHKGGYDPVR